MRRRRSTGSTYNWFDRFGLNFTDLIDPKGWEIMDNVSRAFAEEITEDEFIKRLRASKVDDKIKSFLNSYKKLWKVEDEKLETKKGF
jgi:hypothetical protein